VPFLLSNVVGAFSAGQLTRKLGRAKAIVLVGLAGTVVGFILLALIDAQTPLVLTIVAMAVVGVSIGVCMPSCVVIVQNAAERRDVGSATGALLFLRSMGGAFGSTLVGAVLTARFTERLTAMGVQQRIDLGELRRVQGGGIALDAATQAIARTALTSGFQLSYWICAGLLLIAFVACAVMRDLPLQSSHGQPAPAGH
jgi:MFS family permease